MWETLLHLDGAWGGGWGEEGEEANMIQSSEPGEAVSETK